MRMFGRSLISVVFIAAILCFSNAQAKTWKLQVSTGFSSTSQFGQQLRYYFDNVAANSDDRIAVEYHYGGALAKIGEELNAMRTGSIDAIITAPPYYSAQVPLTDSFGMTFITAATDAAMKANMDVYNSYAPLRDQWEKNNNAKAMFWPPVTNNTLWSNFPVPDMKALKDKKVRALGRTADAIVKFGGVPVGLKWGDIYTSAQRGIISAAYGTPLPLAWDSKFQEVLPYATQTWGGVFASMVVAVRNDLFEEFPADLQQVFVDWARKAEVESIKIVSELSRKAVDDLMKNNKTITIWSEEDKNKAKALVQPAQFDSWVEKMAKKGMGTESAEAKKRYLEAVKKYEASSDYETAFDYWAKTYGKK